MPLRFAYLALITMSTMRVHFTGACGRAIGPLAIALQRRGWKVSASDGQQFAPMDAHLREAGLIIEKRFAAKNVPPGTETLIAGVGITKRNVEVREARRRNIPVYHMAEFVEKHLLQSGLRFVVAGTNGKTTATTMLAWILEWAGKHPDYLFGGQSPLFDISARFTGSKYKVIEGDEYIASVEDPRPKFGYYHPHILLVTSFDFDHAEVFSDLNALEIHFRALLSRVPRSGAIILPETSPTLLMLSERACAEVHVVGTSRRANCPISRIRTSRKGVAFEALGHRFILPLHGTMNVRNAVMAALAASWAGVSVAESAAALAEYKLPLGRLQPLLELPKAALVLDHSYHPSAIRENIVALRQRYPRRRVILALQPRYTGGRSGYQMQSLPRVLAAADAVILSEHFDLMEFPTGPFSTRALCNLIRARNTPAHHLRSLRSLPQFVCRVWKPGDVFYLSLPAGCSFIWEPLAEKLLRLAKAQ